MKTVKLCFKWMILMVGLLCIFDVNETHLSCGGPDILKWFITAILATTAILHWAGGTLHHSSEVF